MSQSPITISYSLEEVLTRLEQKMDRQFESLAQKIDKLSDSVNQKIDKLDERLNKLEIGQTEIKGNIKALDEKVNGLSKRLENQEFVNRGVLIALIVAIVGGFAKILGFVGNP